MNEKHDSMKTDDSEVYSKIALLTELQAHQTELEIQNCKFKDMQQQLEAMRSRYADLYDNAPVGYLTLDKAGNILAINLTGSSILLGKKRASILNKSFLSYIVHDDNHRFLSHLQKTFNSSHNVVTELRIKGALNKVIHIRLESLVAKDTDTCRTVMTNINLVKEKRHLDQELLDGSRRLMQNLFKMQEEERRFLARELHDELGQWLTAIHAETETIAYFSDQDSTIYTSAQAIKRCVKKMHEVMHDMLRQLRPTLLDTLGLEDALLELREQWITHNPHIILKLKFEGTLDKLNEHTNITIFRIVQEALNNVRNHAQATRVLIRLNRKTGTTAADDILSLSVKDNGKGYNVNQIPTGLGLLGIRERAIASGGKFSVRSTPNHGTQIHVKLPLDSSNRRRKTDNL
ncbi:ATP-binding protein [Nitrosomonas sp. Nm132]|uniref:ATP-binding protein n=1 Tax=Nitrosomonas sp. Nm132 TaxID=1881053 RepID=UPI0008924240|nr:ATP-binding protein [Nitrosomonas sp. Nm132]SDH39324.1 two-component system, NarL family, nitrate/nitrite sensor histidine kinase NarX/two-component system, NarL family, sensor histidine kinase UhpB [Nitrosomonas sp. Nm132]